VAKDSFRLKILKEVAGSNVYDEKKEESRVILKETEEKRQNIGNKLRFKKRRRRKKFNYQI
jgi:structural maintenance of chromosome 3 (chondroitin sulfate proteoglycan 6)